MNKRSRRNLLICQPTSEGLAFFSYPTYRDTNLLIGYIIIMGERVLTNIHTYLRFPLRD